MVLLISNTVCPLLIAVLILLQPLVVCMVLNHTMQITVMHNCRYRHPRVTVHLAQLINDIGKILCPVDQHINKHEVVAS